MKANIELFSNNRKYRSRYIQLGKEILCQGINAEKIDESMMDLSSRDGKICYLKPKAYEPTGIALGAPLPDKAFANLLWRLSRLTNTYFSAISSREATTLALVPKEWYHVTLVNRTHYEFSNIMPMSEDEKAIASTAISSNIKDPIKIFFNGVLLTRNGRLIVLGFPCDNQLSELRTKLANILPELRINLPNTVHIKLGHLIINFNDDQLFSVISWLFRCSLHVNQIVSFDDFYCPRGRIVP